MQLEINFPGFDDWCEHIESLYGWHHERVYVSAWNLKLTSEKYFFDNYVYLPF